MFIIKFLKNRRKNRLLKAIYKLKEQAAMLNQSAHVAKEKANKTRSYITLRQEQAAAEDGLAIVYLQFHLHQQLEKLESYENDSATYSQKYLNIQDQIARLEKELENL